MHLHWHRFSPPGLPVEFPALRSRFFRWRGLYGIQIGDWFFGAVKGSATPPTMPAIAESPDRRETTDHG